MRENFLRAISIAGSQEELVEQVTEDIAGLLIPRHNVTSYETCQEQVRAIRCIFQVLLTKEIEMTKQVRIENACLGVQKLVVEVIRCEQTILFNRCF